ncbi:uncharacterized protein LOC100376342 [Saccoglossus kowalevskii]|uniref:GDP-fucose protein O-fucosyltransferase 2 n=1 Tax=Saccoglossus kowalevskii TaxID=10224 RepID=A0ABM0H046_SACKO|nr:PREDICTED: uncharacterized protein LOC100376342 [Saccoglossus kowalevskii]
MEPILKELGMGSLLSHFIKEEITPEMVSSLTADDWLKMGVTIGKRLKIIERCRAFVENEEKGEIEREVSNIFRRRESVSCRATEAGLMANKAIDKLKCSFESGVKRKKGFRKGRDKIISAPKKFAPVKEEQKRLIALACPVDTDDDDDYDRKVTEDKILFDGMMVFKHDFSESEIREEIVEQLRLKCNSFTDFSCVVSSDFSFTRVINRKIRTIDGHPKLDGKGITKVYPTGSVYVQLKKDFRVFSINSDEEEQPDGNKKMNDEQINEIVEKLLTLNSAFPDMPIMKIRKLLEDQRGDMDRVANFLLDVTTSGEVPDIVVSDDSDDDIDHYGTVNMKLADSPVLPAKMAAIRASPPRGNPFAGLTRKHAIKCEFIDGKLVQDNTHYDVPRRRYLLPVHKDANGPNCQYQAFRGAMKFAMAENRTLVEMWFRNHGSAGRAYSGRKFVNETFDVDSIKQVVDLVSVEEFRKACNGTVDGILIDPFSVHLPLLSYIEEYKIRRNAFTAEYAITLPGINSVPRTPEEQIRQYERARTVECLAYFEPDRLSPVRVPANITRQVDLHLIRTPQIRKLAEKISTEICNNKPFICMHWRNRSGEVAHCPSVTQCGNLTTVINVNKTAVVLAEDVKKLMSERKLECIYVAFPPLGEKIVKILKNAQIRNVVTRKDITGDSYPVKLPENVRLDNYHTALLEQEICIRSHLFLSHYSSLSKMIRDARDTQPGLEYIHLSHLASWKAPGVVLKRRKL